MITFILFTLLWILGPVLVIGCLSERGLRGLGVIGLVFYVCLLGYKSIQFMPSLDSINAYVNSTSHAFSLRGLDDFCGWLFNFIHDDKYNGGQIIAIAILMWAGLFAAISLKKNDGTRTFGNILLICDIVFMFFNIHILVMTLLIPGTIVRWMLKKDRA